MTYLCIYSDERMTKSAELLAQSATKNGINEVYKYGSLPEWFIRLASPTINESKGAGLYIWKPWVVYETMSKLQDGDILIYADAGQTIVSSVLPVIEEMDQDIMMFSNGWQHIEWCKMDVANAINGSSLQINSDYRKYNDHKQAQASLIFFRVNETTRNFVKEWMLWCLMPGFCDNSPSKLPNESTFQETRWDQSVLTCLQIKYGYRLHWFPSLTNFHNKIAGEDNYPAIVDHHRKRNPGATNGTDSEW